MKIFVQAKPNSREEKIDKLDENHYVVSVKEPPIKGKANVAISKVIADFFNVPPTSVRIISGYASRRKIIEIFI
jgi:uncharacterized protein (TIGR00251 family)